MTAFEYFGDKWSNVIPFKELSECLNKLSKCKSLCPDKSLVFKAFKECPYDELKVVMLGQDPYPQKGIATGIAFGNNNEPLSPSLEVIKESCINYEIPHYGVTFDNSLESWAKQGILLLNSALTCEVNRPGSHVMLWRPFISRFIYNLSHNKTGIIYVLFGEQAQTFKPYIGSFNDIIEIKHPAYYARTHTKMPYSLFTDINKLLYLKTGESIKWFTELK